MAKIQKVSYYETANGPVKTLAEWKSSGVFEILKGWKDDDATTVSSDAFNSLVTCVIAQAEPLVEILSHREKGRPNGKRDSKPRKPKETPATV